MSVIPIHTSNFEEGCGFFIGHYFLTQGHVIANSENPHILVNQNRINLVNPIFFEDNKVDPRGYDLAIFDVKEVHGTLELSKGEVKPGEILKSFSYKELGTKYVECDIEVNDYKDLLFGEQDSGRAYISLVSGDMTVFCENGDY